MELKIKNLSLNEKQCVEKMIISFIREQVKLQKKDGVLIGISGGIDSAVVAALAVKAVGKEKVNALVLPDVDSDRGTLEDAKLVTEFLKLDNIYVEDITAKLDAFGVYSLFPQLYSVSREERERLILQKKEKFVNLHSDNSVGGLVSYRENKYEEVRKIRALWNAKIRLRMAMLYFYAEQHNLLVLGTTNKTEYEIGWFTKFGDGGVDIEPIVSLYKTYVFELAMYLGIPKRIIEKKPSGDILPGLYDSEGIGVSLEKLDRILLGLDRKQEISEISKVLNIDESIIVNVNELKMTSIYNRENPIKLELNIE